jgi:hypothetical protein
MAPNGKLMKKHHLQLALSVNAPPSKGPMTLANANTPPKLPNNNGLVSSLVIWAKMVKMEMNIPLAPTPWNALPKMSTFID